MVVQFGYVSLFSIVWPIGSLISFINNWIELRSDAIKMCINYRCAKILIIYNFQFYYLIINIIIKLNIYKFI